MSVGTVLLCLLLTLHCVEAKKLHGQKAVKDASRSVVLSFREPYVPSAVFGLFLQGEDTCSLDLAQLHTLTSCGFNSSNPLIIITHGWSVDGMMESWVLRLATTMKNNVKDVNVVIIDWLNLAHQHYPIAVQSTRTIGKDLAYFLTLLKDFFQFPAKKVHLIGYSLGAHISGFAGSYMNPTEKIGRITGLDPAGPLFEGMSPTDRLSPDDAEFVDAIHTFTRERMGLSVGIKQAVAHFDFYPNGGDFQPGCDLHNIYDHISEYGLHGFQQTMKCAHERSVHLFIDSVLNKDRQSMAYRCSDNSAFDKGVCLDCRKNRCNTLGYNIKKVATGTSKKLYLKTRSRMPYKLFHSQFRVQFINQMDKMEPSLTISLTGTKEESGDIPITFTEDISGNRTFTFLLTLDKDLGELMFLKIHWEGPALWRNMWDRVQTIMPWSGGSSKPMLTMGRISVKAGETQDRTCFCALADGQQVQPSLDKVFVRCKEQTIKVRRKKHSNI
ncbi:unnamed protein product [Knipowitschia caucasica]|uniref:Hepatic triacylglycerol lipase n=1 Tax=Knipowitschia caucasica TaxID=637954 RepID=A0AAV2LQ37_KNICA